MHVDQMLIGEIVIDFYHHLQRGNIQHNLEIPMNIFCKTLMSFIAWNQYVLCIKARLFLEFLQQYNVIWKEILFCKQHYTNGMETYKSVLIVLMTLRRKTFLFPKSSPFHTMKYCGQVWSGLLPDLEKKEKSTYMNCTGVKEEICVGVSFNL